MNNLAKSFKASPALVAPVEACPERSRRGRCGLATLFLLILVNLLAAQDLKEPGIGPSTRPKHVSVAPVPPLAVRPGSSAHVELAFRVAPGFHINSNTPSSDLLVPTVLKLDPPTNLAIAKVTYPAGRNLSFAFAPDEKLSVYTGDFIVGAMVSAARSMPPGRYRVHGELKYQACDNKACYPPTKLPVAFDVKISKSSATHRTRRNPAQSPHVHQ